VITIFIVLWIEHPSGGEFAGGWFGYFGESLANTFSDPHSLIIALPVLIYLWWRGIVLGRTTSYFRDIYTSFIVGMVFLIVLIILWQITRGDNAEEPGAEIALYVIAFFFFGLISIAICHLSRMHQSMPREEAARHGIFQRRFQYHRTGRQIHRRWTGKSHRVPGGPAGLVNQCHHRRYPVVHQPP